jgi:ABC-type molybdate transport system ATPase subunit
MKPTPDAVKMENMKMWLEEQIERYENLAKRFRINGSDVTLKLTQAAYESVLARLTEDEKC